MQISNPIKNVLLTLNITLATLWVYQGLVPKIIYKVIEEQQFWQFTGISLLPILRLVEISGAIEIIFGVMFLIYGKFKFMHFLNILSMLFFFVVVAFLYPHYFVQAFNPFVMNFSMMMLSVVALQILAIQSKN